MTDRIERSVIVGADIGRVWRAVSDHREFGAWFRVALNQPFVPGTESTGHITYPGYEHIRWRATVEAVEPPRRLAFRWHPYAIDPERDYSHEPTTLVEFLLRAVDGGTEVRVIESGFDQLPDARRDEAFRMNAGGWTQQMDNIRAHLVTG